jgi:hypothetical protein
MAKYERPRYEVLKKENAFEIRHYDAFSTSMVKEGNIRGYSGFGVLFRYISGDNDKAQPISMTVPVFSERGDEPSMEFVIPKDVAEAGIPLPNNPSVTIRHYEAHTMAVVRHRGRLTQDKVAGLEAELRAWLVSLPYSITGPLRLAQYDGPAMPPFLRTSELLLPVEARP